jgi:tRNA-dihydrouridine synthase B
MNNKTFWQEKIAIGKLVVPRFMSAPLDGLTTSPFRQIIRSFSPHELLFTEMRHVAHVSHDRKKITLTYAPIEQPLAFQFSANAIDFIPEGVEKVINSGFVMINLNSGCPAKTVIRSGAGSALMADLPRLETLIKHFMTAINGHVPFTLKIRAGFKEKNALEVVRMAEACGVDAIIIHPRTQPEGFSARLDFDLVQRIKAALKIPVIFSGNINSFATAQLTYERTGVDGFMIGRALWGAPWKIRELTDAAQGIPFVIRPEEAVATMIKHLDVNVQQLGSRTFVMLKKHIPLYIRTIPNAAMWRDKLLHAVTEEEMRAILSTLCTHL